MADTDLTALGKYQIVRPLGRGAMGIVYEAFDPIIERRVAIKTVRLDRLDDAEAADDLARFKREAQAAGRLTHPNIVGVYDYGESDTLAYIVMEFVEGDTLKFLLDRGERFTPADAVALMAALLDGLAFSHENGVIHRDIKPANVMITRDGRVKIADFGVARIESSSLTQAGTMIGTPSYMSPEQFMGQTIDARTDIYSAGVLLYQLLTGEKPFEGSVTGIMHKVLNVEPPAPSALSVSVSPALDGVVRRAMAKRPEERFDRARDFAGALRATETAIQDVATQDDASHDDATMIAPAAIRQPTAPATSQPAAPPRRTLAWLTGGGTALIVAGIAGFLLLGKTPQPPIAPPVPVAPPAVPAKQQVRPDPAALRRVLTTAIGPIGCTLIAARLDSAGATLSGIADDPSRASVSRIAATALRPLPVTTTLRGFTGPYCGLLDTIRPFAPLFAASADRLGLRLAHNAIRLKKGEHIIVHITQPAFAGYLVVEYIESSGKTYRLYPSPTMPQARHAATTTITLGEPPTQQFAVGSPYGRDMILAISSSMTLHGLPKSRVGTVATLLPALRSALHDLKQHGATLGANAILVDTVRRN